MKFLNRRELKPIIAAITTHYGYTGNFDGVFHMNTKNRLYFAKRSIETAFTFEKLHVKNVGLYIGEFRRGSFRFSIEGSQLFGPKCTQHLVEIADDDVSKWMAGEDLAYSGDLKGFVLVKNGNDFLSCGNVSNGTIKNFIPKGRRVKIIA